jgi:hypothetical protein
MSSASWALQQAIFATLSADMTLSASIGRRLYDAPPRKSDFPYVVFCEDDEAAWNTAGDCGSEHNVALHVWSRAGGRKECKEIAASICALLDDAALTPAGHRLISLQFVKATFERIADGKTFRARLIFRAVTEPSA